MLTKPRRASSSAALITFGSACSYQIGASLSVFGAAGHVWLFLPYLLVLFLVGTLHTRVWGRRAGHTPAPLYTAPTFLQKPTLRAVSWRIRAVIKQFLLQAMPICLLICLVATIMEQAGVTDWLSHAIGPLLQLPAETASGIVFSILHKDGLLLLNQDDGALLRTLGTGQLFVLVYLASTLTACLVTLWTVRKELGWRFACSLAGKQMVTSVCSALLITVIVGN